MQPVLERSDEEENSSYYYSSLKKNKNIGSHLYGADNELIQEEQYPGNSSVMTYETHQDFSRFLGDNSIADDPINIGHLLVTPQNNIEAQLDALDGNLREAPSRSEIQSRLSQKTDVTEIVDFKKKAREAREPRRSYVIGSYYSLPINNFGPIE